VNQPESELARLIFHELTHQVAFASGDTVFNESFATTVERLGSARWLAAHGNDAARDDATLIERRREDFLTLTRSTREQLAQVYAGATSDDERRQGKAETIAALQAGHAALKAGAWHGYSGYDAWFGRVNNATLGMVAAYDTLVPHFELLLAAQGNDLPRFFAEVQRLAALPRDERWRQLGATPPP
jgi:predicted aminopeptidase